MKIYNLKRTQFLPITIAQAWDFFSSPENLSEITPPHMGFKIVYQSGGKNMYPGQIIKYKIKVLPWMAMQWITEITHVKEPHYFVDEQRFGPYALWHHQHYFKEVAGGTEVTDEVNYAIPYGLLGRLIHVMFVRRELNRIFNYRFDVLTKYFSKDKTQLRKSA